MDRLTPPGALNFDSGICVRRGGNGDNSSSYFSLQRNPMQNPIKRSLRSCLLVLGTEGVKSLLLSNSIPMKIV